MDLSYGYCVAAPEHRAGSIQSPAGWLCTEPQHLHSSTETRRRSELERLFSTLGCLDHHAEHSYRSRTDQRPTALATRASEGAQQHGNCAIVQCRRPGIDVAHHSDLIRTIGQASLADVPENMLANKRVLVRVDFNVPQESHSWARLFIQLDSCWILTKFWFESGQKQARFQS